MPRPKRTKVAPSAPAPRLRQATKPVPSVAATAAASKAQSHNDDEISDPEVKATSAQRVRKHNGKRISSGKLRRDSTNEDDELPEPGANLADQQRIEREQEPSMSGALFDDIDLESSEDSIEVSRRDNNTPLVESSRLSLANFRRRPRQPSILGRGPGRARSSSVESNLAHDNVLMSVGRRNNSVHMANTTRGRPRQASVTRGNVGATAEMARGTPAHAGSVLNLGNFRRRAREPSILGTAQKRQDQRPNFDLDDEDDFEPDDESTPLNFHKSRGVETPVAGSSNSRKRKLSGVQVPQSSASIPSPSLSQPGEAIPATLSDNESTSKEDEQEDESEQDSSAEELPMPSIEHEQSASPDPPSSTMAPPQSSSSPPSSPRSPNLPPPRFALTRGRPVSRGRSLRNRTPPPRTQDSPISSPPALTHSPNRRGPNTITRKRNPAPPPSAFSTAQLQNLMPRRRRRRGVQDPFDVPSSDGELDVSGLASDDDELSHIRVRARPGRRATTNANTTVTGPKIVNKGKAPATARRVYGSRAAATTTSDKENEELDPDDSLAPLPDDEEATSENSQELERRVGRELKMAARKFAEVDQWELEFEDVTASSDSPRERDAR